jgi:hypothetical protein
MANRSAIPARPHPGFATILLLLLSARTLAQDFRSQDSPGQRPFATQQAADTVSGTVASATDGRPLAHAVVTLYDLGADKVFNGVTADDHGSFRFASVPAGRYRLTGRAKGYLLASYLEHDGFGSAIVTGAGLNTQGLQLKLNRAASISGHIVDQTGEPVEHATVTLYREFPQADEGQPVRRFRIAATNSSGEYEFIDLAPGTYFLSVTAIPWYAVHPVSEPTGNAMAYRDNVDPALDVAYPLTFYPHTLSSGEASPLVLHAGEEANGDMQLVAEHALSISLRLPSDPQQQRGGFQFPQITRMVFGAPDQVPAQTQFMNDVATVTGLAPGQYVVQRVGNGGLPISSSAVDLSTSSVTLDSPPETPTGKISVTLRNPGGTLASRRGQLMLWSVVAGGALTGKIDNDGTVEFLNVPPGAYRFTFSEGGRGTPITAILKNDQLLQTRRVNLNSGQELALTVSISASPVSVSGVVQRNGKPVPGAMVVLVPAGADTSAELFRRDQSDLDGGFTFHEVIPGKYLVVAIEDGWPLRWTDTTVMMPYLQHSAPLEVPANATSTHLDQPVAPQPR